MSDLGAVIIADNTDNFDYIKLAGIAAGKVKKHLGIPVALITSENITDGFDHIIKTEYPRDNKRLVERNTVEWRNLNRTKAYDLTPFDRTLLIDADYLINNDALLPHCLANFNFAIAKNLYDPATGSPYTLPLGKSKLEQLWATIMIFNKCELAAKIFAMSEHVLEHYLYYSKLYQFNSFPLRNDYAFTIACHLMGGYGQTDFSLRNHAMFNCDFNTEVEQLNDDDVLISYNKTESKKHVQRLKNVDIHIQNKTTLFEKI